MWWIGRITTVKPLSSNFPESKFLCYGAEWANGDAEKMSPWDLEVIPDDFGK
jgi:PH-interacting protein